MTKYSSLVSRCLFVGRLLVGLRWWNYVDDEGKSHWIFESRKVNLLYWLWACCIYNNIIQFVVSATILLPVMTSGQYFTIIVSCAQAHCYHAAPPTATIAIAYQLSKYQVENSCQYKKLPFFHFRLTDLYMQSKTAVLHNYISICYCFWLENCQIEFKIECSDLLLVWCQGAKNSKQSDAEVRIFWLTLVICPLFWVVFFFASLFKINFKWFVSAHQRTHPVLETTSYANLVVLLVSRCSLYKL